MPSTDVKPFAMLLLPAGLAAAAAALPGPHASAGPLGTTMPANCVAHTSFDGGADAAGDYRCAGLAIDFHTAGVGRSPFPIWAGQWLFVDERGQYRVGSCTFNRGVHPTIGSPSHPVSQSFPNDPTGAKGAYLTWKYGDTTDNLTAAAMWAVFHYYAQDAAGTNRASNGGAPLIASLDAIAAASGRPELQAAAHELDDEAVRYAGQWQLSLLLTPDGVLTATLLSGTTPVPAQEISVLVSGSDAALAPLTDTDGKAMVTVPLPSGTVTVVATASAPGSAVVFKGAPAEPDPQGAQTLVTGGAPTTLRATAQVEVAEPTTTEPATTEPTTTSPPTVPSTTAVPEDTVDEKVTTTTTVDEKATTTVPTTTVAPTTTIEAEAVTTTVADSTTTSTEPAPLATDPPDTIVRTPLPRTGKGVDGATAYVATALLVGGVGLLGTIRRRDRHAYTAEGDAG